MVEFVKGKALIGPAIIVVGGAFALIVGVIVYVDLNYLLGLAFPEALVPPIVILILGIVGLLAGVLAVINIKLVNYITVVLGLIGIIYMYFVPEPSPPIPYHYFVLSWIGPPIILVGGVIGVIMSLIRKE
ncbi:MAG: hypothetical protein ACFE9S_07905 [Candidatus Hermodarchaeota archaeon]